MKVTKQNSNVCCRDLKKSHFMNAIANFSGEFPSVPNPPPLEISAYAPGLDPVLSDDFRAYTKQEMLW